MQEPTQEDWQYMADAVQDRFNKARPKKGEPPTTADFTAIEARCMQYLLSKAYPSYPYNRKKD